MATWEYAVDITWPGPGLPGVNVWHFRTESEGGDGAQAVVDVIEQFYVAVAAALFCVADTTWTGAQEVVKVTDRSSTPVDTWTLTQSSGDQVYMSPVMLVLTLATSSATKSGRGRKFIGPVGGFQGSEDGTPQAADVAALQAAGAALVSASQGLTLSAIGVYSPTQGLFRDLTSTRVRDVFATLRSRRD